MRRRPDHPAVNFGPDATPEAPAFGDIYFSREGGLAESEAVFLTGCGMPELWRGRDCTTIGEIGFGAGLNALAVWRLWRQTRSPPAVLHFVSVEAFPLAVDDAARALATFPELADLSALLLARWPVAAFGVQRLWFEDHGLCLTLHCGDGLTCLSRMEGRFDAWFLDGFAPSRNPALWAPALFERVAALSAPNARLATYSTAGHVRRGLEAAGFAVERKPGFARKRERLEARLVRAAAPWHPMKPRGGRSPPPRSLVVLGAGIAGASVAASARRRGMDVSVLDAGAGPGAGASGNPIALVMPRLDRADSGVSRLFRDAYLHARDVYAGLGPGAFSPVGVIETARPGRKAALADLLADPPLPDALFGPHPAGALHAGAGYVVPLAVLEALLKGVSVRWGVAAERLEACATGWTVRAGDGAVLARADAVVIANGSHLAQFSQTKQLPLEWSQGQVDWSADLGLAAAPARAGGPYAAIFAGGLVFGATFDPAHGPQAGPPTANARAENLAALAGLAPDWRTLIGDDDGGSSRASVRAATSDRAPIAGLVPDWDGLSAHLAPLKTGATVDQSQPAPGLNGLYVLGGLGARGFVMAPLLAESVIADMMGEPQPLDSQALAVVHPARFFVRAIKRGLTQKGSAEGGEA